MPDKGPGSKGGGKKPKGGKAATKKGAAAGKEAVTGRSFTPGGAYGAAPAGVALRVHLAW